MSVKASSPNLLKASFCRCRVIARLRPAPQDAARSICVAADSSNSLAFSDGGSDFSFEFDHVLAENSTQKDVFCEVRHIVNSVLTGRNGTIMSYGQTGSGKTHTLIGDITDDQQRGVVPRAAAEIFAVVAVISSEQCTFSVQATAVEIYCERIRDLLSFEGGSDNLSVQQDKEKGMYIAGAKEVTVRSEDELIQVIQVKNMECFSR